MRRKVKETMRRVNISVTEWRSLISEWTYSKEDREILEKHIIDGLSFKEIAEAHNLSEDTVKQRFYNEFYWLVEHIPQDN